MEQGLVWLKHCLRNDDDVTVMSLQLADYLRWRQRKKLQSLILLLSVVLPLTAAPMHFLSTCIPDLRTWNCPRFV